MSKQAVDLTIVGHRNGDADGLGALRGLKWCLAVEVVAALVFGVFLYWMRS